MIAAPLLARHLARRSLAELTAQARPAMRRNLARLAEEFQALLQPAAICKVVDAEWPERGRALAGGVVLRGAGLARLTGADRVAVGFATIGEDLGREVAARFARGDRVTAVLLDQLGNAALLRLGRRLEALIRLIAHRAGQRAGSPVHPGDDGVDLGAQAELAALVEVGRVGIGVTATAMLTPAKSLSMVVALGDGVGRWSRAEICRACPSQGRCRHGLKREACA